MGAGKRNLSQKTKKHTNMETGIPIKIRMMSHKMKTRGLQPIGLTMNLIRIWCFKNVAREEILRMGVYAIKMGGF
jgi:hypothetical protein